jgi:hypothetical protein
MLATKICWWYTVSPMGRWERMLRHINSDVLGYNGSGHFDKY